MLRRSVFAALILLLGIAPGAAQSDWTWRYPVPQGNNLAGLLWTGTQLVAVGEHGTVITSPDGIAWTVRPTGTSSDLRSVAWSGTGFVAVGSGGVTVSSEDGTSWSADTLISAEWLMGIAWTGKSFATVGKDGKIFTSPDGRNWTPRESGVTSWLWAVAWTGTRLVAVGHNGLSYNGALITSGDGVTWAAANLAVRPLFGVAWTGSQVVAVGDSLYTSPDGLTWTPRELGYGRRLEAVTAAGNRIVGVGSGYGDSGLVLTTPDGAVWSALQPGGFGMPNAVAWTGRRLVAAGDRGFLEASEVAATWTTAWKPALHWLSLAHSPAGYVAVGSYRWNDAAVAVSADGRDWEFVDLGKEPGLRKVLWHGSRFVAIGDSGRIFTSPDGRAWTRRATGTSEALSQLSSSGSLLIAAGAKGSLFTSQDGIQWAASNPARRANFPNLIWAGNRFLLLGDSTYASADGAAWSNLGLCPYPFIDVAWSGSRLVGLGLQGIIYVSADGVTWKKQYDRSNTPLNAIVWSGGEFAAVGDFGTVITSPDGLTWTYHSESASPPTNLSLSAIHWDGKQFLAAGDAGAIFASLPDAAALRPVPSPKRHPISWIVRSGQLRISLPGEWLGKKVDITVLSLGGQVLLRTATLGVSQVALPWKDKPAGRVLVRVRTVP
jgi:hypothetical protein